jgi:hypothetical protein
MPTFRCITPPPPVETLRLPHRLESLCYNHPRSAVHSVVLHGLPSTVYRPSRSLPSAVRGLSCRPSFLIRLFVPHSLTARPSPQPPKPMYNQPRSTVHRPFRGLSCHPQSLIRLFVPNSLTACPSPQPRKPMYNHPRSTVHRPISRSILPSAVPHSFIRSSFVDGSPLPRPPSISRSAVRGLRSILRSAIRSPRSEINLTPRRPRCLISEPG